MKSAYDLAMERLNKADPQTASKKTTKEQKERLAEVERVYRAKIAEQEISLQPKIQAARFGGETETADSLQIQLRDEVQSLREKMEGEKQKIREA